MNMRNLMRLACVAILTFGSAAHAVNVDGTSVTVTYAKETLLKGAANIQAASDSTDLTVYYPIVRSHAVTGPTGISAAMDVDNYYVTFALTGMVFAAPPEVLENTGSGATGVFTLLVGGAAGDNYVTFQKTTGTVVTAVDPNPAQDTVAEKHNLVMNATFAVSENGGGITRTVVNNSLKDVPGVPESGFMRTLTRPDAIKVLYALKETVLLPSESPVARAEHDFMAFGGAAENPTLTHSFGTIQIGVMTPHYLDARGIAPTADPTSDLELFMTQTAASTVDVLDDIIGPLDSTKVVNAVTFDGDFSFASLVALEGGTDCATASGDIRVPVSGSTPVSYTDAIMAQEASTFSETQSLCITADGETAIQRGSYTVTTMYSGKDANTAFPPVGRPHSLATIGRDGTEVHIPYLTLHEKFNHRITLSNRGNRAVPYSFSFRPEAGVTATAGSMAAGDLMAGDTLVLLARDIVSLDGGHADRGDGHGTDIAKIARRVNNTCQPGIPNGRGYRPSFGQRIVVVDHSLKGHPRGAPFFLDPQARRFGVCVWDLYP